LNGQQFFKEFPISMKKLFALLVCLYAMTDISVAQTGPSNESRVDGGFVAAQYNYGGSPIVPAGRVFTGNTATGSQTITAYYGTITLPDGRVVAPYSTAAPIIFGVGANAETLTPSAVAGCVQNATIGSCQITATFANLHGTGDFLSSGTFGLQEAINDANGFGGGTVVVDIAFQGATATITSVVSATPKVWVADIRGGPTTWFGKSGTGAAAYSAQNNDVVFTVTLAASTATKTLSQTYTVAPICTATDKTAPQLVQTAPTTSTIVVTDTVGATDVIQVVCALVK
jgi:hypothetical protein